ncbi:MAG: twin-arginine translocase subunit TatC [Phycisphaerales bacterium]|jgi:sec-independent protein translocase protein TatC|nr:twin-arginine translocase subunit TatC [Phycisphaerales bacterium]
MADERQARLPEDPADYTMSLGDHLEELRRRVIAAIIVPLPLSILIFFIAHILVEWLLLPLQKVQLAWGFPPEVQVLSPPEFLLLELKLSVVLALVLSLPWLLWQAWLFIGPGLYPRERRFVYLLLPGSGILTLVGIAVMYFVMLPLMLQVLMLITRGVDVPAQLIPAATASDSALIVPILEHPPETAAPGQFWVSDDGTTLRIAVQSDEPDHVQVLQAPLQGRNAVTQVFQLSSYVNFVLALLLGVSLAFQLPLVLLLGGWLGLLNAPMLRGKRKWALLVCAAVSAITTPADAFSMLLMLVPLYALYEFGIILVATLPVDRVVGRSRDGDEAA